MSEEAVRASEQHAEQNFRFNFIVNLLDGAFYWFGTSFISPAIILPLYISHFTNNPIIIGLIPFISTAGFLLPQLFMANVVERAPLKKTFPVKIGFFTERVPVMLIVPSVIFFAINNPGMALLSFILLYAWYSFGAGIIIVGWQDMIAKIIPVSRRGRFFGITNFIGMGAGILGAVAVSWVLNRFDYPNGFVLSFAMAALLIFLSWLSLSFARELPVKNSKPRVSQLEYFRSLPGIMRRDPNFLRYVISQIVVAFSGMAAGFLAVYSAQAWNLSDSQASGYNIAMQIGQAVTNPLFGILADRKGHKLGLEASVLVGTLAFGLAYIAPNPIWFYPIFFLRGAFLAGSMITAVSIAMEFSQPQDRPTYIGLANTIPGVFSAIAPMIGGLIASATGYRPTFLISTLIGVAALLLMRFTVRDPRHLPKADAIHPQVSEPKTQAS